jgi:putative chitinase
MSHAIDLIDASLLKAAAPETPIQLLAPWADPIKLGCIKFGVDHARGIAALLAQAAHESGGFQHLSENLNYSAEGLARTWPKRFAVNPSARLKQANALALSLERKPELIANHVYANRMGNGPPESGDGWRYRGEGPFQITGHDNQAAFAASIGMPLEEVPAYLATINGGAMSMCWFFQAHGLEDLAQTPGCADETRVVNGALIGLADRTARFTAVLHELQRRGAE